MNTGLTVDNQVLTRVLLLQTLLHATTDLTRLAEACCHGLQEIPGVDGVTFYLRKLCIARSGSWNTDGTTLVSMEIRTLTTSFGSLHLGLTDEAAFHPYRPYVENTANLVALIQENRIRDEELENANRALKSRVETQTGQLVESRERYVSFAEASFEGILIHDEGKIIDANTRFQELFGYDLKILIEMRAIELIVPEDRPKVQGIMASGNCEPYEAMGLRKDSTTFPMEIQVRQMRYHGKQVRVAACRNITERKRAEEERQRLHNETRERVKELRCMYGIADAVRTRDTLQEVFEVAAALLPTGWRYPEITCARLRVDGKEYCSEPFEETRWKQSAEIAVRGHSRGAVEVFYLEERPELDEGPFLNEERNLINGIANTLSEAVEHVQSRKDREKAEMQLRHAHKMDAIGQLTGGIAHDFNNILGIILGNVDLLKLQMAADESTAKRIEAIQKSARRAASLTRKLLSFSHYRGGDVTVINLNELISDMKDLIARSVTPEVEMEHHFAGDLWLTEINNGDFEDALINLVLNARDAMPNGGRLTLETCNRTLDAAFCAKNAGAEPGHYVELAVSDTGEGIPRERQQQIFEPYFTTKDVDKGTGLGLAMVYGFTKRSMGYIQVHSEPGIGTTFRLYLPRSSGQEMSSHSANKAVGISVGGTETLLVVDDEEEILELAKARLEGLGYRVLSASDGKQALEVLTNEPSIALLFSDVVMPGSINGYHLAELATASHSSLKVLLSSGYAEKTMARNNQERFAANLLSKPYSLSELAQRIRDLLDDGEQKTP